MEYSPVSFKHNIDKNSFKIKKFYGQNFISDENVINKIVDKSDINKDTLVIEIGPGIGSLTYKLAKKAGFVMCYEIDETLKPILFENMNFVQICYVLRCILLGWEVYFYLNLQIFYRIVS